MKRILLFLVILTCILGSSSLSYADFEGTVGTQFTINGEGFGASKPTVYTTYEIKPGKSKKIIVKVLRHHLYGCW